MPSLLCNHLILWMSAVAVVSSASTGTLESTCVIYRSSNVCNLCVKGYYPDANGTCRLITIPNCDRVDSNGSCMLCGNGVLVKDGKCDTTTRCSDSNCALCAFNMERKEKCVSCNLSQILLIDESLKYGECVTRSPEDDPRCISKAELSHMGLACYACDVGYTLSNNKCAFSATFQFNELNANFVMIFELISTSIFGLIILF